MFQELFILRLTMFLMCRVSHLSNINLLNIAPVPGLLFSLAPSSLVADSPVAFHLFFLLRYLQHRNHDFS